MDATLWETGGFGENEPQQAFRTWRWLNIIIMRFIHSFNNIH